MEAVRRGGSSSLCSLGERIGGREREAGEKKGFVRCSGDDVNYFWLGGRREKTRWERGRERIRREAAGRERGSKGTENRKRDRGTIDDARRTENRDAKRRPKWSRRG